MRLDQLPPLREWDTTRNTLHAYVKVIGAIPRALAKPHPQWWHVSLKPTRNGLQTDAFILDDGRTLQLLIDIERHVVVLYQIGAVSVEVSSQDGISASELAAQIERYQARQGIEVQLDRWQGSLLSYDSLVGEREYVSMLKEYYSAIYHIASPGLMP